MLYYFDIDGRSHSRSYDFRLTHDILEREFCMSTPIAILIIVILFLSFILPFLLRRLYLKKLFSKLEQKEIEGLNLLLDSTLCKLLFRPFNREFLRLNGYLMNNDFEHIDSQFIFLIHKMQLNPDQSLSVLNKAFNYYLSKRDVKHTNKVLKEMKKRQISDSEFKKNMMLYEIILEKKTNYIDEISKIIEKIEDSNEKSNEFMKYRLSVLQYLMGLQYSYLHDTENMNKYFNLALVGLTDTPFENEIQKVRSKL